MIEYIAQAISIVIIAISTALLWRAARKNEERMSKLVGAVKHAQKEVDNNREAILNILNREELNSETLKLNVEKLVSISIANKLWC